MVTKSMGRGRGVLAWPFEPYSSEPVAFCSCSFLLGPPSLAMPFSVDVLEEKTVLCSTPPTKHSIALLCEVCIASEDHDAESGVVWGDLLQPGGLEECWY